MDAGDSGTPLARKLGIAPYSRLIAVHAPEGYESWLAPVPEGVEITRFVRGAAPAVHLFVAERTVLARELGRWRKRLDPDGFLWVSWPKKASRIVTDVTEESIRELALPLGFVDVKVCSVDAVWSGLKLVIRAELRGAPRRRRGKPPTEVGSGR